MERRGMLAPGCGNYKIDESMHALLESHIKLDVTDPHDRIYGFPGIVQTYGLSFSGVVKNIGKDPRIVFISVPSYSRLHKGGARNLYGLGEVDD